jgi:acyl transferase domain-containing protein/acyl carrier protein
VTNGLASEPAAIEGWLVERVAQRLKVPPDSIDPERTFDSYGLGSVDAVELSGELEERLGRELEATLVYEHPTIRAVARALCAQPAAESVPTPRRAASHEPVAIVGVACRLPGGGDGVDAFWRMLVDGRDAGRTVPADRWDAAEYLDPDPATPGKAYTQHGGFVDDVAGFDAELFGLSPAEALRMDPQQRMLLELAWAALEDAALPPDRLRGTRTGVFVGLMESMQYTQLQLEAAGADLMNDPFFAMGAAASVAAGRIAYLLDLHGPTIALDTACSSSLVCTHLGVQSLRQGESDLALVGGASLIAHPQAMVQACKMGMLARDGRVKAFDAAADGFLLGEGSAVVLLERLSDATANGHPVRAVIEGSAVNQDGRSNGITAPNRSAQVAVVRDALADAGLEPDDLDYVEAHGSGTGLGDAIEVGALRTVFKGRRDALPPLRIGSVKTNVGHLQAAAGVAGLIKAALMLERGQIAPTLHLSELNPALKLDGTRIAPATERSAWPPSMRPRRAGVSSFGWSGTNAHAILQAPPRTPARRDGDHEWHVLPLSASCGGALDDMAGLLRERLAAADAPTLGDAAYTLGCGRATLKARRALHCRDRQDAVRQLGQPGATAYVSAEAPEVAVVLPDSAGLDADDLRALYQQESAFRRAFDRVASALAEGADAEQRALLDPVSASNGRGSSIGALARAREFAGQYAIVELWRAWGIVPNRVLGSGVGRQVAACVSGRVGVDDLARLVVELEQPLRLDADRASSTEPDALDGAGALLVIGHGGGPELGVPTFAVGADRPSLLRAAAGLWEQGAPIDWEAVFEGRDARRVRLPTYPFRHARFWPDRPAGEAASPGSDARAERGGSHGAGKRPDLANWSYAPTWRQSVARPTRDLPDGPWLILAGAGAGAEVTARLRATGRSVTLVAPGDRLELRPGGDCVVDPREPDHLYELIEGLRTANLFPGQVIHAWSTDPVEALSVESVGEDIDRGFASLMSLVHAIGRAAPRAELELVAATTGASRVLGDEPMAPARAMLASLARCAAAEQPTLRCRHVDIDLGGDGVEQMLEELLIEPVSTDAAWRGGRRWVLEHDQVALGSVEQGPWRDRGVYLITGGLGGLGLILARHLARSVGARLALVGRSGLPDRQGWEALVEASPEGDRVTERIRAVLELERDGAEVLVIEADVADPDAIADAVAQAKARFGALHGVVHAAGVPGGGLLQGKTRAEADAILRPKVLGTVNLAVALAGEVLDFVALYSSATAVLGGIGESDYAAANAFMGAWAAATAPGSPTRVVAIDWGAWTSDTWQQRLFADVPDLARRAREYRDRLGIADDEGVALLTRILASRLSNVLVLPQDPETTRASIAAVADPQVLAAPSPRRQLFPRPELRCAYRAPSGEVERQLTRIWSEQLGIEGVGVDDPFFELGGNSLIGLSILARIEAELGTALPPAALFERPTVAELAALLDGPAEPENRLVEHGARGERRREMAARAARRKTASVGER